MNKSIDKLMESMNFVLNSLKQMMLEEYLTTNNPEKIKKELEEYEVTQEIFHMLNRCIKFDNTEVFDNFNILTPLLNLDMFSSKDVYNIIMFFINNNTSLISDSKNAYAVNYDLIGEYKFKSISKKQLKDLVYSGEIKDIVSGKEENYDEFLKEYMENRDEFLIPIDDILNKSNEIKELINSIQDESDVNTCVELVETLGIEEDALNKFKNYLFKKLEKKKTKLKNVDNKPIVKMENSRKKKYLSESEVKSIRKSIYEYYNIHQNTIIAYPDNMSIFLDLLNKIDLLGDINALYFIINVLKHFEEENYSFSDENILNEFIYYMVKFNVSKGEYIKFLNNCFMRNIENPFLNYTFSYDRLSYYDKDTTDVLDEYFKNAFICDKDEYIAIKNMILEEMNEMNQTGNFDYEIKKVGGILNGQKYR